MSFYPNSNMVDDIPPIAPAQSEPEHEEPVEHDELTGAPIEEPKTESKTESKTEPKTEPQNEPQNELLAEIPDAVRVARDTPERKFFDTQKLYAQAVPIAAAAAFHPLGIALACDQEAANLITKLPHAQLR